MGMTAKDRPVAGARTTWRCVARNNGNRCSLKDGHRGEHTAFGKRCSKRRGGRR
jgi:hypothetical protein